MFAQDVIAAAPWDECDGGSKAFQDTPQNLGNLSFWWEKMKMLIFMRMRTPSCWVPKKSTIANIVNVSLIL